jgi:hypothetical protein
MDTERFKRLLTSFADKPTDFDLNKGQLILELHGEILQVDVHQRQNNLYIKDGLFEELAENWIVNRIARIPQLADRIVDYVNEEKNFVRPQGKLLEDLIVRPNEKEIECQDAMECALEILRRRPAGTTHLLYLISDAGEGKTTLINEMARLQAEGYKKKIQDWLLLPVSLGGRPFIRLDDVIIGTLVNQFRFQFLYYESFLELIRMGVIVLALDGFEEVFVERASGEAVSALGSLVQQLGASGTIMVASRKAYFEYTSFETQARLFDTIRDGSVSSARLTLRRWGQREFLEYCNKRGLADAHGLYNDVVSRLTAENPVTTRPVLVKGLIDIASSASDRKKLLDLLQNAPHESLLYFIRALIEREAAEKWIDRSGEAAQPLLSVQEHHELLSLLALEMWVSSTDIVNSDFLELIAEIFCESRKKPISIVRQVRERIRHHALLVSVDTRGKKYAFDHEEFKNFFLGMVISQYILERQAAEIRNTLRVGPLPDLSAETAVSEIIRRSSTSITVIVSWVQENCRSDGPATFLCENCGGLIIRLINGQDLHGLVIMGVTLPSEALARRRFNNVEFVSCYFQPTSLDDSQFNGVIFRDCTFERLEANSGTDLTGIRMVDTIVRCMVETDLDTSMFDPVQISQVTRRMGVDFPNESPVEETTIQTIDDYLMQAQRAIRVFMRSTEVNENVFRQRLGKTRVGFFLTEVLPPLIRNGIIKETGYFGSGNQRRFRLVMPMRQINDALERCKGDFNEFLRIASRTEKQ